MDASDRRKRAGSEAADWFSRLQAGTMDRAAREQFVEWLRESHLHVAEMLRLAQIHGSLERFQRWTRISTGPKTNADNVIDLPPLEDRAQASKDLHPTPRPPPDRAPRISTRLRLFALTALVVVVVGTALVLPRFRGEVVETQRGERREVVLNDGTILQVDPETRLRVKYADTVRRVSLERGRALFHVAKNPNRPFLVEADDTTVRAVGTAFGVEDRIHGVVVTVAEGKVAVLPTAGVTESSPVPASSETSDSDSTKTPDGSAVPLPPRSRQNNASGGRPSRASRLASEIILTANQQVIVPSTGSAEPVRQVDSQRELAWAEGRLIFQNDELGHVVAEFNRYNRVQLTVTDSELAVKPVSGVFNAADPEAFLAFLQSVTPLEIVRDGERSITIAAARPR